MNPSKIAKALTAGATTALGIYWAADASGSLSWLALAASLCVGVLSGVLTWAVPNADTPAVPPAEDSK